MSSLPSIITHSGNTGTSGGSGPVTLLPSRLVLAVGADMGTPGAAQDQAVGRFASWTPDAIFCVGDNNYGGAAGYDSDWAAFLPHISDQIVFPALGNHCMDSAGWEARHYAKFPYLPGNKRHYSKVLGSGLVENFVMNSGLNTARELVEPDGNTVGSDQHAEFVARLRASTARWKIGYMHHPPGWSVIEGTSQQVTAMDWPEILELDALFIGHAHTTYCGLHRGVLPIFNVSGAVLAREESKLTPRGPYAAAGHLFMVDDDRRIAARVTLSPADVMVELVDLLNGSVVHQRSIRDKTHAPAEWRGRAFEFSDGLGEGEWNQAGYTARHMEVTQVMVAVDTNPSPVPTVLRLYEGTSPFLDVTIPPYWKRVRVPCFETIRFGTEIGVRVISGAASYAEQAKGCEASLTGRYLS